MEHPRLLRSMRFGDDDYDGCVISVLRGMVDADLDNINHLQRYLDEKYPEDDGEFVSNQPSDRKLTFAPDVFIGTDLRSRDGFGCRDDAICRI